MKMPKITSSNDGRTESRGLTVRIIPGRWYFRSAVKVSTLHYLPRYGICRRGIRTVY